MFRLTATTLRAAAIAIPALLATSIAVPAAAQSSFSFSVSFDDFHDRLAPYGTWSYNPRWGEVWHPTRVERGFRPYYNGRWEDTREYGWLWVSDEPWGDIPYHYGRWAYDPHEGWLWVPGYVWGPSWVVWRSGGGNIGWFPMPPDDNYYGDGAYRDNFDNQYGYRDWYGPSFSNDQFLSLWTFIAESHFRDRNFRNYAVPQRDYGRFISQTRDTTNYVTINNYVVNRSVDDSRLQRDTNQRFQPVAASNVIGRNALVTQAAVGRQVEQRERRAHPIPVNINPAEQRGPANLNTNAVQQNLNQTPQGSGGRGGNRGFNLNGSVQPNPQTDRGAPVADTPRQNRNQAPQGAQDAGGNPNQGASGAAQPNPQTGRRAPVANTPPPANATPPGLAERRSRGQASPAGPATPPAPVANTAPPKAEAAPQGLAERRSRGQASPAGPATPPPPVANTAPPKAEAAPQGLAERRSRGQASPAGPATPPPPVANTAPPKAEAAPQGLAEGRNRAPAVQTREAPAQNGRAIAQDTRTPPRVQGNNQTRANRQADTKNADEKKAADEKKKAGDRGQN